MSNWLDVRIKLYSDKSRLEEIAKKFKDYFYKSTKRDPNASINLGSQESKFVWCAIKSFENFNSIVCYTKVGFDEINAIEVCKWIIGKFEEIKDINIQTRDDASKIFAIYHWTRTSASSIKCKKIDPLMYPNMKGDLSDSYSEEASKRISVALKQSGITTVLSMNHTRDDEALDV